MSRLFKAVNKIEGSLSLMYGRVEDVTIFIRSDKIRDVYTRGTAHMGRFGEKTHVRQDWGGMDIYGEKMMKHPCVLFFNIICEAASPNQWHVDKIENDFFLHIWKRWWLSFKVQKQLWCCCKNTRLHGLPYMVVTMKFQRRHDDVTSRKSIKIAMC